MKTAQYKFLIIIIIIVIIIIRLSQKYNWQAKYQGPTFHCYFFRAREFGQRMDERGQASIWLLD